MPIRYRGAEHVGFCLKRCLARLSQAVDSAPRETQAILGARSRRIGSCAS